MIFSEVSEFTREFKKLAKKYKTLDTDLGVFKAVVSNLYEYEVEAERETFCQAFFDGKRATELPNYGSDFIVVKARFDCAYLNKDSLRIVFVKRDNKIVFVEIFNKSDKVREDIDRIKRHLKS